MSVSRLGSRNRPNDYNWPGFVDALASLLMVFVFVLMVFVLIQANLAYRVSGQDASLSALRNELNTISSLLRQERNSSAELSATLSATSSALRTAEAEIKSLGLALDDSEKTKANQLEQLRELNAQLLAQASRGDNLQANLDEAANKLALVEQALQALRLDARALEDDKADLAARLADNQAALQNETTLLQNTQSALEASQQDLADNQAALAQSRDDASSLRSLNEESQLEIERLIAASLTLRNELSELRALLAEKEAKSLADKVTIASLGKSLNAALADRVQELQRFRSDFFGRLRDILGNRSDVTIVGDRFIFQSEVLFDQGQANLGDDGQAQLRQIGMALIQISQSIPADIPWVLQVDGHTDDVPVSAGVYRDNWQLSTERALSVVRFLINEGVPAERLAATGYGEFQPIAEGTSDEARNRNRRIELKFTQRLKQN
ncbi:MAG: OmpA family protein [Candidatus Puniceispirillaceae bacterium]